MRSRFDAGTPFGITSICSAHPLVIAATFRFARRHNEAVLIEATCNQVNHLGGYTGLTPRDFRDLVFTTAAAEGVQPDRIVLGGDHLGPAPWVNLSSEAALGHAIEMVEAYVRAGFSKIHLDTSMACADDPAALPESVIAERAALLAATAESVSAASKLHPPYYVIGTEVPPPGGAREKIDHLDVTDAKAVSKTIRLHRAAFDKRGLGEAFARVVGLVVQPGVEFGNLNVHDYDPQKAMPLTKALSCNPGFVYEAHSTDYQVATALQQLVKGGFAILKVGPELTFALREAFYALDAIATVLGRVAPSLPSIMEDLMQANTAYWKGHYHGSANEQKVLRHFSYSDRIRYYWNTPEAQKACQSLLDDLEKTAIPPTVLHQYLPALYDSLRAGTLAAHPRGIVVAQIERVLERYHAATR